VNYYPLGGFYLGPVLDELLLTTLEILKLLESRELQVGSGFRNFHVAQPNEGYDTSCPFSLLVGQVGPSVPEFPPSRLYVDGSDYVTVFSLEPLTL
jgi:hypothetical protein